MDVNFGFLSDYADNSGGKLNAIGIGFDTIFAKEVPATHRQFYAILSVSFSSVEVGSKEISLHIIDADGNDVVPRQSFSLHVLPPQPGYITRTQRVVLGLGDLVFPSYGDYSVVWLIGDQVVHRMPLKIATPPTPPSTA